MKEITRADFENLLKASQVRPRLKRELRFVPENITDWGERDFMAILTRTRSEGVLVIPLKEPRILSFRLSKRTPNSSGRVEAIICDLCATWQTGTHSCILTFELPLKSISYLVCGDLDCSMHVRNKTSAAKRSRTQLRETMTEEARIERLQNRLEIIALRVETAS